MWVLRLQIGCKLMAFFDECCLKMTSQTHNNQQEDNHGAWGEQKEDELALEKASAVDALWEEEIGADEFNLLEDDDMHIFGQNPLTDILNLVACNICRKPVIDSQFLPHYERCNAARESELRILLPDNVQRRRRSLRGREKEKLATVPEKVPERSDQRDLHNKENTDDQGSALPLLEKGEEKAEVSERIVSETNVSEVEKMLPSKSKSRPNPKGPLVSDDTPQKEVPRRGLRSRKRDVSAVCSDLRSQLPAPLSVSNKRKEHTSAVLPDKFSQRPSGLPVSSKRRIHTRTHELRGDDQVKELSGARKRDGASAHAKEPPKSGETTIDKETQRGRQVAEKGSHQEKQGSQRDDKKGGDDAVKCGQKQGTKRGDKKGDEEVKTRRKQDGKSSDYKSLGDARASRLEQRNRIKNQPSSVKEFNQKPSSKNGTSEELKTAMKPTESPMLLSESPDFQGHSGNLAVENDERELKDIVNPTKEKDERA